MRYDDDDDDDRTGTGDVAVSDTSFVSLGGLEKLEQYRHLFVCGSADVCHRSNIKQLAPDVRIIGRLGVLIAEYSRTWQQNVK